jgi:hypothetical protein
MNSDRYLAARFVVGQALFLGRRERCSEQHFTGNAKPHPALRAPGMDMRAGDSCVMHIPWGVAP